MRAHCGDLEVIDEEDCRDLLATAQVGRVVLSVDAMPAAFPVHYVLIGREIYFRTPTGTKLTAAVNGTVVAFQVDEFDAVGSEGWSVLVVGPSRLVADPEEQGLLDRAGLRSWVAPTNARYAAIGTDRVTGRRLWSANGRHGSAESADLYPQE